MPRARDGQTRPNIAKHGQTLGNTRVPQGVGWGKSGNRNVEGWWGFLQLKIKKIKDLKFQSFRISIFQVFKVSKLNISSFRNSWNTHYTILVLSYVQQFYF